MIARGALDGLAQDVAELHVLAGARLHDLAVGAEDAAEGDVFAAHDRAHAARDLEDLLEMERLRGAGDIQISSGFQRSMR